MTPNIRKMIEHRTLPHGEIRAFEEDGVHYVELQIVRYNVVDDYGSLWAPGCFSRSLGERMPTLAWAHDWSDILGRGILWSDTDEGPVVRFRLDDFDAVPRSRQAYAQVLSGTIDDCSVGFSNVSRRPPTQAEKEQFPGVTEVITDADEDETSLVLRGAVPGAKVVGLRGKRYIRSSNGEVDEELFFKLVERVKNGEMTKEEAKIALDLATITEDPPETKPEEKPEESEEPEEGEPESVEELEPEALAEDIDAEITEALESVGRLG